MNLTEAALLQVATGVDVHMAIANNNNTIQLAKKSS
jgi:hypothetical protein